MIEDVVVEPMREEFIVWRCLHGGPLSRFSIDQAASAAANRRTVAATATRVRIAVSLSSGRQA